MTTRSDAALIAKTYFNDPVGYVRTILRADPDEWQADVLRDIATNQRVAVASGHGIGKTAEIAWIIRRSLSRRTPKTNSTRKHGANWRSGTSKR